MQPVKKAIMELYRSEAYIPIKHIAIRSLGNRIKKERERGADKEGSRTNLLKELKKLKTVQVVDICPPCKHWWVQIGEKRLCLLFTEYKGNAAS